MREDRDKNFWSEFFKWFLIWEFIGLIFKGIIYVCKLIWLAFKQLVWLIYIGIKKITPIIREKASEFYTNFNTTYKPKIAMKFSQFRDSAKKCKNKLKNKLVGFVNRYKAKKKTKNNIENKIGKLFKECIGKIKGLLSAFYISFISFFVKLKKKKTANGEDNESKEDNGNVGKIKIQIKKVKYSFLNFYYDYELLILIGAIIVIIIAVFIIFQSK